KPIRVPAVGAPRGEDIAEGPSGPSPADKSVEKGVGGGKAKKAEAKAEGDGKNAVGGLAIDREGKTLWAVLNMRNTLAEIDLASGKLRREMGVGNAPYGVVVVGRKAYVTNWAGRHPGKGDTAAESGTASPVRVDPVRH